MTIEGIIAMFENHDKQVKEHYARGEIYGSAYITDLDMMLDEILVRLEAGQEWENLLFDMEKEGYESPLDTFTEYECRICKISINSNEFYHRGQLCLKCEIKEDQKWN